MIIECPHCNEEIEIDDSEIEFMHKDGYIQDYECPECGMLMDISVEVRWYGEATLIENVVCDECKGSFRERDIHFKGRCSPWPLKENREKLISDIIPKTAPLTLNDVFQAKSVAKKPATGEPKRKQMYIQDYSE